MFYIENKLINGSIFDLQDNLSTKSTTFKTPQQPKNIPLQCLPQEWAWQREYPQEIK